MYEDSQHKKLKRKIQRRVIMVWILAGLIIVNTVGLFTGALFYKEFCILNTRVRSERFNPLLAEIEKGKTTQHWEDISILSLYRYTLKGTYIPNPRPSNKTVIFLHGITANRLTGLWYIDIYLRNGFNVLVYDSRAQGESGGPSVTWGFYEKYDLDRWVDWVEQKQPGGIIGVHGVSMGAATALMHAELNEPTKRVKFYIADSAYSDLEELLMQQINGSLNLNNEFYVKCLLKYSSTAAYIDSGFFYAEASPIRSVANVTTPILFLHGENDRLIPVNMCYDLYATAKGPKAIHIFPNVGHAEAIFFQKDEYFNLIQQFIQ